MKNTKHEQKGTIKVSDETKDKLRSVGTMGESFEDVILRLIFIAKNGENAKQESKSEKELNRLIR